MSPSRPSHLVCVTRGVRWCDLRLPGSHSARGVRIIDVPPDVRIARRAARRAAKRAAASTW
eukprot:917223-Rhodomonas_salina.2